jgi:hypothetical protein
VPETPSDRGPPFLGGVEVTLPNLDDCDPNDLDLLCRVYRQAASYAEQKAQAMRARAAGDLTGAAVRERLCEALYQLLPEEVRW